MARETKATSDRAERTAGAGVLYDAASVIAGDLNLTKAAVAAALVLLNSGATVPFIARYRKEQTRGLDEEQLRAIEDRDARFQAVEKRRSAILDSLNKQGVLTEELEGALTTATDLQTLEDLYLPYRPRRRTRADRAREAGLQPLADQLLSDCRAPATVLAERFDPSRAMDGGATEAGMMEPAERLAGACDILAADCAADVDLRSSLRSLFARQGAITSTRASKKKNTADARSADTRSADTYRDYFDWREPARGCPSHRMLALLRGESEGVLRVEVRPPEPAAVRLVADSLIGRADSAGCTSRERRELLDKVAADAYRRLLAPSLETEMRHTLRERAEEDATGVFAANLKDLLLSPPLGARSVLALDPGFRTGSKVVALNGTGEVAEHATIYPLAPQNATDPAERLLRTWIERHRPQAIAVGSGTGGRELEQFVRTVVTAIPVVRVNEAGASVYSASREARSEMPDLDVTIRGAVSIGRRLQDPLSELVKIDPAAVGVGQYQHDIDAGRLDRALSRTVESCVNAVGVELNTAGSALLARVSGLGASLGAAIVNHREQHGAFSRRNELGGVPGIGARTLEQAAGFLRCGASSNPLDNTGVHPERYDLVERMARDQGCSVRDLCGNPVLVDRIRPADYVVDTPEGPGLPTVQDILRELKAPGRDPRPEFTPPAFREDVHSIDDVQEGMTLAGVVTNVTKFGAFVDLGVHRDGLIHISHMADTFVRDPHDVVRVGQQLEVTVLAVDRSRQRIDLSLQSQTPQKGPNEGRG